MIYLLFLLAFPAISALQRFAVSYGYRGMSKEDAISEAILTFVGALLLAILWVLQ